jgi:membrane-associated protease RseP (regulator of RpoE activity)
MEFDRRPLSVWCGRFDEPGEMRRMPLRLWLPRGEPLYFFVPKGTKHFVIGIVSGGDPRSALELRTADGTAIRREGIVAGDQISVIVEQDVREYGEMSEMAKQAILPGEQLSIVVPRGEDGRIWALQIWSLRCIVELYDVPPFVARHPAELLVPEDSLK